MLATVLQNGKLLKTQTINEDGEVEDYFKIKKTCEFGVTKETAGPEPEDWCSLVRFFPSQEAYDEAIRNRG